MEKLREEKVRKGKTRGEIMKKTGVYIKYKKGKLQKCPKIGFFWIINTYKISASMYTGEKMDLKGGQGEYGIHNTYIPLEKEEKKIEENVK